MAPINRNDASCSVLVWGHFMASILSSLSSWIVIPFIMRCNLTQITVLFASEYTMKWCKLERWFDANCSISLCEMSLRFVLNHVIVWLSMLCNSLKYGAHFKWGRLSFWIFQSIQGNCKVCWKELTYILLLRMWVQQQPLYLLRFSTIFSDIDCDKEI